MAKRQHQSQIFKTSKSHLQSQSNCQRQTVNIKPTTSNGQRQTINLKLSMSKHKRQNVKCQNVNTSKRQKVDAKTSKCQNLNYINVNGRQKRAFRKAVLTLAVLTLTLAVNASG